MVEPNSPNLRSTPRAPIVELLFLAGPTVAQMASYTVMQFIDTWMLAQSGSGVAAPTAAGNAGGLAFSMISIGMGTLFVINTLVSQSFGRKDFVACGKWLWQGIWFALAFSALLLPILPFVARFFTLLGHERTLAQMEAAYIQIVIGGAVLKLTGIAFSQFLLAIDRPNSVLMGTIVGVSANAVAAWAMIFGRLGFRPLGVLGSAWGQNVGVFFEMSTMIFLALRPSIRRTFCLHHWIPRPSMLLMLLRIGIPSGVQIIAEVLAWTMYPMWVMAPFGTKVMAANTFIFRYMAVSFMPAYGIGSAVTALVGRFLGAENPAAARRQADMGFVLAAAYMLACGVLFFVGRHWLIRLFTQDAEVLRVGAMLMVFAAIYQFFDGMYIIYLGALRGAGDTFVPAVATAGLCWSLTVGGGWLTSRLRPDWGSAGPWSVALFYGVVLGVFMMVRFRRGHWKALEKSSVSVHEPPGFPVGVSARD